MSEKIAWKDGWKNLKEQMGPVRLAALLGVGILLLVLSMPGNNLSGEAKIENNSADQTERKNSYRQQMEGQLEELLSQVEGIGRVKVMITLEESSEQVVLKDTPIQEELVTEEDGQGQSRRSSQISRDEVTVGDTPYIIKTREPVIRGVVVLSEGSSVILESEIVEAVQVLFDLPAHKIKVMKYK